MSLVFKQLYNGESVKTNNGLVFKLLNTNGGGSGGGSFEITKLNTTTSSDVADVAASTVGTNIYLFGGLRHNAMPIRDIYKFDTVSETFTIIATFPKAMWSIGIAVLETDIYLFGGCSSNNIREKNIYKFDTTTEILEQLTVTLPVELFEISATTLGSDIYLFTGYNTSAVNTIYKFNTISGEITLDATLPTAKRGVGAFTVGTDIYFIPLAGNIQKYDTTSKTITTYDATNSQSTPILVGKYIYLFGGYSGGYLNTIQRFNISSETIETMDIVLDEPAIKFYISTVGTNIYLFGGRNGVETSKTIYKISNA